MSVDAEILADFLIETEELIANLGQQILDMEDAPDDTQLLNAVFRSFHTVKGGAGFLELTPMVDLCHTAEELCNGLRAGKLELSSVMVDDLSAAVDQLQAQHESLTAGENPEPADPELLIRLKRYSQAKDDPEVVESESTDASSLSQPVSDDDFEALLDQFQGVAPAAPPPADVAAPPLVSVDLPVAPPEPEPAVSSEPVKPSVAAVPVEAKKPAVEASIRVETSRLDSVMNLVGELVLARNHLKTLVTSMRANSAQSANDEEVAKLSGRMDRVTTELQNSVMKMRMQAIRKVFSRFPKIVRDLARSLGKEISLELQGEETELDKNLVEELADPLIHLVRNAVDHGVETPERRLAAGKPAQGLVRLSARQEGDDIVIRIQDDGAGMDPNVLRALAIKRGVLDADQAARMDAHECFKIIFMPGFSTREEVSDVSGRGVGMDVVKTRIDHLNGLIHIDSELGEGTTMELRVPLTLAIMASLMVRAGKRIFAVPLSSVDDVLMFDTKRVTTLDGRRVYMMEGEPIPILVLGLWSGECTEMPQTAHMVLMRHGTECFGLVVDSVIGREEVVIKPLGPPLTELAGFSGATVTGDGRVALILDPIGLQKILREHAAVV